MHTHIPYIFYSIIVTTLPCRKSLTTVDSKYVQIVSFEGGGDDMDWPIKQTLLSNKKDGTENKRSFCGVNSYNIGRPLVQMVHFVSTLKTEMILNPMQVRHTTNKT